LIRVEIDEHFNPPLPDAEFQRLVLKEINDADLRVHEIEPEYEPLKRRVRQRKCVGCKRPTNEETVGCRRCRTRRYNRNKRSASRVRAYARARTLDTPERAAS
jgi:uncharacterized paraquat-inducible protein A